MSEKTYQTTADHFASFIKYCKEYIDLFGLKDWRVDFAHTEQPEYSLAECEFSTNSQHAATIRLATTWSTEINDQELRRTAVHEVCHVMLADSYNVACWDDLSHQQTIDATSRAHHAVIRRLENIFIKEG